MMKKNYTTLTLIIFTLCLYTLSGRSQTKLGGNINGTQGNNYSGGNIIAQGEESGHSVSVSADGKIVAIGSDLYSTQKGRVRVYEYKNNSWTQLGGHIVGEADYDWFGHAVSLSADGKTVAIGATGNNSTGNEATANVWDDYDGHVRIYEYKNNSWIQLGADIDGPNGKNDQLGYSVSLSADGRTVAIGSRGYDVTETTETGTTTKTDAGRVQIYKYTTASGWEKKADINGEAANDKSGSSVSLSPDGKTVAVGVPFHDATETTTTGTTTKADAGQVRVYKYSGTGTTGTWDKVGDDINGPTAGEKAGWSVSLSADGKTVAIGAPEYKFGSLTKAGRVQVYQYNGTGWIQVGSDVKSGGFDDTLGRSVSLSADGKTVAFGIEEFDLGGTNIGRTMVYQYSGNSWTQRADIRGQAGGDASGSSVALSADGTTLATGSPKHNHGRGHVRVYQFFQITSPSTASVAENTLAADFSYTITAGGTPAFTLGTAKDEALFNLNGSEVTFKTPPDYENPTGINKNAATAEAKNVYEIQITATSGTGSSAESITKDVKITVTNVVEAPVFTSAAAQEVAENATATGYTPAATKDASVTTGVAFSLVSGVKDNDLFAINSAGEITFQTAPDYENPADADGKNDYELQITASAGTQTSTHDLTITVTNVVEAPVFTSDAAASTSENTTATGYTAATGTDTDAATFSLANPSTDASVTVDDDNDKFTIDPTTGVLTFNVAPDFENPGSAANSNEYKIQITAKSGAGAEEKTATHNVTIEVTDVLEFSNTTFMASVDENTPTTTTVYTFTSATPSVSYAPVSGFGDNAQFTIDGTSGVVKFVADPDYENAADTYVNASDPTAVAGDNVYHIRVTATASISTTGILLSAAQAGGTAQTATQDVTITVNNVVEIPVFSSSSAASTPENTTATGYTAATGTDTDAATFSLEAPSATVTGDEDNDKFTIDPTTGTLTFNAAPDFENPGSAANSNEYKIQITATATDGTVTEISTKAVTITVTDIADETPPVITSGAMASVPENTTVVVYTATATDASAIIFSLAPGVKDNDLFAITSAGLLSFKNAPDFENPVDADGKNDYELEITARDEVGNPVTQDVTITVDNVVEVPVFTAGIPVPSGTPSTVEVAENTPTTTTVYTAAVSDVSTKDAVTFSLASTANDNAQFTIDRTSGAVKFKAVADFENPADADGKNDYNIQITATAGTDTNAKTVTKDVVIKVTNVDDTAPNITSNLTVSVPENTTNFTYTITANEAATFALGTAGGDEALFNLEGAKVSFKAAPDFETPKDADNDNVYKLELKATDAAGNEGKKLLSITVTDVDEIAPNITSNLTVSVPENTTNFTYTITANEAATFALGTAGGDEAFFNLEGAKLTFKVAPDFETRKDADNDNVYKLELKATDAAGNEGKKLLSITVTDVDEIAPVITSAATAKVKENTTNFTYTITANETATFALGTAGGDEALFKLDANKVSFRSTPDFEAPKDADTDNVYKLELKATDVAGNTGKKMLSIEVTNVAEQATIALPETLAFADTKVGETVSKVLTISNPSEVALDVTAITYPTGFTGDWSSGTIAAGGEQVVNVSFKPTEAKSYTGTITVESDAGSGRNTLSVSGKGILVTGIEPARAAESGKAVFPGLSLFPNPVEDLLNIKLPNQTSPVSLQLVDVNGQVVYEREAVTSDELSIDVSGYRSGVYVLVLSSGSKVVQRKVVIK